MSGKAEPSGEGFPPGHGREPAQACITAGDSAAGSGPPHPQRARLEAALLGNFDLVWRTLRGCGVGEGAADDAAQQVFLVLARRLAEIPAGKERAFLVQTAIRTATNFRRSQRRQREAPGGTLDEPDTTGVNPEQLLVQKQRREALERLLERLPSKLRAVFVLFELEGLSTPEIGTLLALPRGTVASRLRRARLLFSEQVAAAQSRHSDGGRP